MTRTAFAATGPIASLDRRSLTTLIARGTGRDDEITARTAAILERVRIEGDDALRALAREFDGVSLDGFEVPRAACRRALDDIDAGVRAALERAAANIAAAHRAFKPREEVFTTADGVVLGRRPDPLERVGVYAPGGRASYPSSLLMGAVPARVAGVDEVIACSPPLDDGAPALMVRAACAIADVDRLFAVGGAGAIAAMAYGTDTIPRVDFVAGPGNAFVAEAKRQVGALVGIDSPAGPSELLVLADGTADAAAIAREMLAQAEHDPDAAVVLVAIHPDAPGMARAVRRAIDGAIGMEPRASVIRAAFASRGALLEARSLDEAIAFTNEFAAEHVLLALPPAAADEALDRIRSSGTIYAGAGAGVALGDYMTGANHVLPTGGAARRYSGLSTASFMRWTTWQRIDRAAAASLAPDVRTLAMAERLPAHAATAIALELA